MDLFVSLIDLDVDYFIAGYFYFEGFCYFFVYFFDYFIDFNKLFEEEFF
jgi:hypothetical protein